MTSNTVHDGGCLCGEVRFQAIGEPEVAAVCHCRYCQLRTGSAFGISIYLKSENLKISSARLKSYTFTSESGKVLTYKFCDNCGTTLFWDVELFPGLIGTAGGSYDPPTFWYGLEREVFQRSKADFVHVDAPESHHTSQFYEPTMSESDRLDGGE
ncbi:MAG: GFA family protein [Pseudomonadota bacterium]|jgi:hypothetical protein|nr:GFA family protein [Pseudomonadota bacterium]